MLPIARAFGSELGYAIVERNLAHSSYRHDLLNETGPVKVSWGAHRFETGNVGPAVPEFLHWIVFRPFGA